MRVLDRLRVAARGARASLFVARSRRALTVAGVPNCFDPKTAGVQQSGALRKRGGGKSFLGRTNWKQRYFVLSGPFLAYFASKKKYEAGAEPLKEPLCLAGASVRAGDAKVGCCVVLWCCSCSGVVVVVVLCCSVAWCLWRMRAA